MTTQKNQVSFSKGEQTVISFSVFFQNKREEIEKKRGGGVRFSQIAIRFHASHP